MNYEIELTDLARTQLEEWRKSGQKKTLMRIVSLLEELAVHPTSGRGQVERLRGNLSGYWSRRIDKASRLVYRIDNGRVVVVVVSVRGHYSDK
nr:RelE-like toxin [Caudoviricetes sp.]CAI9751691.1 RelE-like toxin [Caudoviricetes sp.]